MFKELFLAIILGALLGFGITGGYLAIDKKNKPEKTQSVITSPTPITDDTTKDVIEKKDEGLTIDSLQDFDVVSQKDLEINGITTSPNSTIVASLGETIVNDKSDKNGKFKLEIELESGLNIIKLTVIEPNNNQFEKTLNITYSTATI